MKVGRLWLLWIVTICPHSLTALLAGHCLGIKLRDRGSNREWEKETGEMDFWQPLSSLSFIISKKMQLQLLIQNASHTASCLRTKLHRGQTLDHWLCVCVVYHPAQDAFEKERECHEKLVLNNKHKPNCPQNPWLLITLQKYEIECAGNKRKEWKEREIIYLEANWEQQDNINVPIEFLWFQTLEPFCSRTAMAEWHRKF